MELLFKFICFALVTGSCVSLTCYDCLYLPSYSDLSCKYVNSTITSSMDCPSGTVACAKVVYQSGKIERFCASLCKSGTTSSGEKVYCCKSDLCNSKEPLLVSSAAFLLLVLAGLTFRP